MSYRSSLSFVVIDEYLTKLWALGLWIFMKFSVYGTLYNTITLQKNLLDLSMSWVFHVLLYCRIYTSAFSLIALKIKSKFSLGLHLSISHYLECSAGGISPITTVLVSTGWRVGFTILNWRKTEKKQEMA
jgi:hypothetical protein